MRERARPRCAAARTRIALRRSALYKQRLGIRNGEDLRARKNGGENVMLRAQRISNRNSRILENNPSPCKQRRKQIPNRNKNGISRLPALDAALPLHETTVTNYKSRKGLNG